ncbi:hypothetical protein [Parasedimentitalea maritima]|uniref:Uncharacterized protein n=1 Tax=Parasedimentitalea maritima TaxID=2578117 RepID=A0A6A4RNH8_9RHOB|nr:hypothetical protein [Zongyanglinia marina]KAE9631591.1 hypothetical protein GP644_04540 [Zongyanglinia marina]
MKKGTVELTCDHCGAFNVIHYTEDPTRQHEGAVMCAVCDSELLLWEGKRVYGKAELKGLSS